MKRIELTEKQLAAAKASGLTEQQLIELLTGQGLIPADLLEIVQKIAKQTTQILEKDDS